MLKIVESTMRRRPMMVPSRSATAMTMRAREPGGRRIAARVVLAVASALLRIVVTSAGDSPPIGPLIGVIKSPSGGWPWLLAGATRKEPVPATGPADIPAGRVLWFTNGSEIPPMKKTPGGGGVGPRLSPVAGRCASEPVKAANSATLVLLEDVTTPTPP